MFPGSASTVEVATARSARITFYVRGWTRYALEYVPGLLLLAFLALLARFLGKDIHDSYSGLFAILLGMMVRNFIGLGPILEVGTRTYEVFWKIGIVLLGSQTAPQSFREVGVKGAALAGMEIAAVVALTLWLGRICRIPVPLRCLLAAGMAICGVSAVIALAAALETKEEDTSYAASLVLLFGLVTLALLPPLGRLLHLSDFRFGLWAGLSVNNTAEAVATGFAYSDAAGRYSTIAKLFRSILLGAVILWFVKNAAKGKSGPGLLAQLRAMGQNFPKFAIGMLLFCGLASLGFWSPAALMDLAHVYRWAFLLGFAGIGLRTDLSRLRRRGMRPLLLAFGIQSFVAAAILGCVLLLF